MKCFQIVYRVLADIYGNNPTPEEEKDAAIKGRLGYLTERYVQLAHPDRGPVDYADDATRFAYVYRYTTSHANLVATVIGRVPELVELLHRDQATIACVGGGPGSDFLGVVKHQLANERKGNLKFYLLDKEQAWGETWADVDAHVDDIDFRLSTYFQPLDVTDPQSWGTFTKYQKAALITMVYFVSELWTLREQAEAYFSDLFRSVPSGTLLLFIDNNAATFFDWFDSLTERAQLETVAAAETSIGMPYDEQKDELGRFFEKFSYPKLTADVAYRVLRKT